MLSSLSSLLLTFDTNAQHDDRLVACGTGVCGHERAAEHRADAKHLKVVARHQLSFGPLALDTRRQLEIPGSHVGEHVVLTTHRFVLAQGEAMSRLAT